ncbi:zf-HC2 domain-containing protein [Streptomyces sp. NBC_01317]|uniref:anti-sigma factor family protein n=1 Tax=Streptomyces sp. NBC_01317 TaxID=2903822 RepID=UPI002E1395D8|nr:zf-HC2 domain-containing protein [Streptomyces sp. NBC_01317]
MSATSPTPAEQHLGDRLAALVDGELDHDARERVLAHLATCAKCKAEADAQRRLKNVFAQAAGPPMSAGLLARLQGLPGGSSGRDDDDPRRGLFDGGTFGNGVFGVRPGGFAYEPAAAHSGMVPGGSGFRIHEVGREAAERSPWRARRFAFAAASAVSFAAMALGGSVPLGTAADVLPRGAGNNVTPLRAPAGNTAPAPLGAETGRRFGGVPPSVSLVRQAPSAPPGMLNSPYLSSPYLTTPSLAPFLQPTGPALQVDAPSGTSPTATPRPSQLAAPTLPLSSAR